MSKNRIGEIVITLFLSAAPAFGSGFICQSPDGFQAKLFNHVDPKVGTRTPAALIVSSERQGTLLVRYDEAIAKKSARTLVRYWAEGNSETNSDSVLLQVRFREGIDSLEAGETTPGQLIFFNGEERAIYPVECVRYLKKDSGQ